MLEISLRYNFKDDWHVIVGMFWIVASLLIPTRLFQSFRLRCGNMNRRSTLLFSEAWARLTLHLVIKVDLMGKSMAACSSQPNCQQIWGFLIGIKAFLLCFSNQRAATSKWGVDVHKNKACISVSVMMESTQKHTAPGYEPTQHDNRRDIC